MKKIITLVVLLAAMFAVNAQEFVELVEKVNKSVVTIYVLEKNNPGQGDPFKKVSAEGLGSGMVNWNETVTPGPNQVGFDYSYIMAATQDRVPTIPDDRFPSVRIRPARHLPRYR